MIVDTHTHFYDIARPEHCWPPRGSDLYRTCLPADYRRLAAPLGITGTVVVEASPQVVDNEWVLGLVAADPFLLGFVGNLPVGKPEFPALFARLAANPRFLGLRLGSRAAGTLLVPAVRAHLALLADRGLALDVLCNAAALADLPPLLCDLPALRVVVNHVAGVTIDGQPPPAAWQDAVRALAPFAGVYMKVSGLVEQHVGPARDRAADYVPVLDFLLATLGPERLLFGSNWPVSARYADLATVHAIIAAWLARQSPALAPLIYAANAAAAYRWPAR